LRGSVEALGAFAEGGHPEHPEGCGVGRGFRLERFRLSKKKRSLFKIDLVAAMSRR